MMLPLESTLVLCDLDTLLLGEDGGITQTMRDVLQLFTGRGGRFTVFSQRTPRAVRALLGGIKLGAPALLCGGNLAYNFAAGKGQSLRTFEALGEDFILKLPASSGIGIALQMKDGSTRVLRMSQGLAQHLRQERTPYLLANAADISGADVLRVLLYKDQKNIPLMHLLDKALGGSVPMLRAEQIAADVLVLSPKAVSGAVMLDAVCMPVMQAEDSVLVVAGGLPMLALVREAKHSYAAADAPAEVRLAAQSLTLTDCAGGAAAEVFYGLVRSAEGARGAAK